MSFKVALLSLIFPLTLTLSFAQPKPHDDTNIELPTYKEVNSQKVFATDPDNKICFIDFMEIDGYAKELVVKNEKGNYTVILNTFSKTLIRKIRVK